MKCPETELRAWIERMRGSTAGLPCLRDRRGEGPICFREVAHLLHLVRDRIPQLVNLGLVRVVPWGSEPTGGSQARWRYNDWPRATPSHP